MTWDYKVACGQIAHNAPVLKGLRSLRRLKPTASNDGLCSFLDLLWRRASFFLLALAVRSLILSAARFASVARLRALHLRALALRRSMMVAAASIAGCCRTKLGDGWSGDGMTNMMYGVWLGANV
jgi:hypothetical protein